MTDQMPIDEIPEYLNSIKKNGAGPTPLVGMGQIVAPPPKKYNWSRFALASIMFVAVGAGGYITYDMTRSDQPLIVNQQPQSSSIDANPQIVIEEEPVIAKEKEEKKSFFGWLFGGDDED